MDKENLLKGIDEIDNVLARMTVPALTRQDQMIIVEVIKTIKDRVLLSFELEKQIKELKDANKEVDDGDTEA